MAFPAINYCIVCDAVREEKNGKLTILGFYGAPPSATVVLQEIEPFPMVFLLGMGDVKGTYTVGTRIVDPNNKPLTGDAPITTNYDEEKINHIVCNFAPVAFTQPGNHTFQFIVDGKVHYQGPFILRQGK